MKSSPKDPMPVRAAHRLVSPHARISHFVSKIPDQMAFRDELLALGTLMHNTRCRQDFVRFEIAGKKRIEGDFGLRKDEIWDAPDLLIHVSNNTEPEKICISFEPILLELDRSRAALFDAKVWDLATGTVKTATSPQLIELWIQALEVLTLPRPSSELCSRCSALFFPCRYGVTDA